MVSKEVGGMASLCWLRALVGGEPGTLVWLLLWSSSRGPWGCSNRVERVGGRRNGRIRIVGAWGMEWGSGGGRWAVGDGVTQLTEFHLHDPRVPRVRGT